MDLQDMTTRIELPHLRISLFGDCNFRCVYCPPWGENSYEIDKNLDTASLKRILSKLRSAGFSVVKFTGGEPTLRKDLIDIVGYTTALFPEVRLITNAWNLKTIAAELKRAGLSKIEISMDAADAESFSSMTQTTDMYTNVIDGIRECKSQGIPIQINMVVIRQNLDQVVPMLRLVEQLGDITIKILELVFYEYPGYEFWQDRYVGMDEVIPLVEQYTHEREWLHPPGNMGSPMPIYVLKNGARAIVKDGTVGTTYADVCEGCPMYPCQDGLYGLTLTNDGQLKMCKHRPDLHVPVIDHMEDKRVVTDEAIERGVDEVVARYRSARFVRDGWRPQITQQFANLSLVEPTKQVVRWYRVKEYGPGAAAAMEALAQGRRSHGGQSSGVEVERVGQDVE